MRKFSLKFFILAFFVTLFAGFFTLNVNLSKAESPQTTQTELFLPSSPIEFYNLNSPIAVSYSSDGYMIISEYYQNLETNYTFNRINVYSPIDNRYHVLPNHSTLSSISQIEKYGDFIYYVSQSQIYYIPVSDLNATPKALTDTNNSPVIVANFFSFNDNKVVTNTNNYANIYEITIAGDKPVFKKLYEFETFAKAGFLADDGNIYLLDNGTLKYYRASDKTMVTISTINKDVISLLDNGDYVWFTAVDGLYKIKKQPNSVAELVISITENANTLGYLVSPKGLSKKSGNVLIADSALNCIQEVDGETGKFTYFAITTEDTADYRLTKNAENIVLSENYVYALDNATFSSDSSTPQKRIVKVSKDKEKYPYRKIDLSNLYKDNADLTIKLYTASDTHVMIYDGDYLTLYKQTDSNPITLEKLEEYQSASITSLYYLDDSFYYSDTSRENYSHDVVNVHKITIPTKNNELEKIENALITANYPEIKGIAVDFTVDIFSNIILVYKSNETSTTYNICRLFNGEITSTTTLPYKVLSIESDFSGNVYVLSDYNKIYKYVEKNNGYEKTDYTVKPIYNENVSSMVLNYHSQDVFYLGNACIYKNSDNNLNIKSLSGISANNLKETEVLTDVKFVTIKENAKIFKVDIGNYLIEGDNKYFKNITPINNPNTNRVYTVITEIDKDYLLISYSQNLSALIRKTSISSSGDATILNESDYGKNNIEIIESKNQAMYLSNNAHVYSKPIVNNYYKLSTTNKGQALYPIKEFKFNKTSMTLVSNEEGGAPIGYVVSGYLRNTTQTTNKDFDTTIEIIGTNGNKQIKTTILILLIAFTVTATLILIETKLLFKEDKPD